MASERVLVVGSGIVGLTTAVRLLESGRRVEVTSDRPLEATTSHIAAGVWFPHATATGERTLRWSARTFAALAAEAASPGAPVVMRETLMLYRQDPGRPWWVAALPAGAHAVAADALPRGYTHGLRFTVPQALMPEYLPALRERVARLGASLGDRHLHSLDAATAEARVVVNCTGLAARSLAGDATVHPIRGQVVRVANPGLHLSLRDEAHPLGRAYVHPRRDDCILGGTGEVGSWDLCPDPATAQSILRRCRDLAPALEGAAVLEHRVGLRPGRSEVRLEAERRDDGAIIVHNYGHGGAGVTLSWGCADAVVTLVDRLGR
jgi:D-amino-acid oxidase